MACKQPAQITAIVGYCRISRDDQTSSLETERERITAWCAEKHLDLLAIHQDLGVSGGADLEQRPGLIYFTRL